jgi:NAD(P)-dependent dehydrogenase (short-subunit alcohol dehydrogenase family)
VDLLGYDGRRVLVVGGASGIGAAAVELALAAGAEVVVMDRTVVSRKGVTAIHLDLAEAASIDAALDACEGSVDAVLSCAGIADGAGIERVNFVGQRYLVDRLLDAGALRRGSAVCLIASTAGLGWEQDFAELAELLDIRDFDAAATWMVDHGKADYVGTKRAVCAYVARESFGLLQLGVRLNAICPGPTDTPLAQANSWLDTGVDYRAAVDMPPATAAEQAYGLLVLCSPAASAIVGTTLVSDHGRAMAGLTGSYPPATEAMSYLLGRRLLPPA